LSGKRRLRETTMPERRSTTCSSSERSLLESTT
jgi:hypothetical protein